jgi:flavin reductase (DIM6/NTAB) family NADH-FMN oxidoreductase RutF
VDKFARADLTAVEATSVPAPAIEEALAHVECEVEAEHSVGDHVLVVGRVRAVAAAEGTLVDGFRDLVVRPPLFHVGGDRFTTSSGEVIEPPKG